MDTTTNGVHSCTFIILLANMLALAFGDASRRGFFISLDDDTSNTSSSETVVLNTMSLPSDLACSQKCFANEQCAYKSFDRTTKKCHLYKSVSLVGANKVAAISKKVTAKNPCDTKDCGDRCKCKPLLGTEEYSCDCHVEGLNKTSTTYVHRSCEEALTANSNSKGTYLVQPTLKRGPVSVVCEKGPGNESYAVFNHDKEAEVTMENRSEDCGSNVVNLKYFTALESIYFVMNFSNYCKQKTSAKCRKVWFVHRKCAWLLGRSNTKLEFWGGGPQNGTGCACGIKKTCDNPALLCNCDLEDGNWHTDEGYVTLKDVLPLTGIRLGDLGNTGEAIKLTIGPLKCIF